MRAFNIRPRLIITAASGMLCLPGCTKPADPLTQADRLFEERQYELALALYDSALRTTLDPGLLAFNRGAVLSKLNRHPEAERAFRQALDDGAIPRTRQAKGLYNLGICLLKQADEKDTIRLKAALDCFERAGGDTDDGGLRADAEYNRQIAEALYAAAKAKGPPPPDPEKNGPGNPADRPDKESAPNVAAAPEGGGKGDRSSSQPGKGKPQPSDKKPLPGAGSLPVLIDADEPQKLSAAETRELLEKADGRLRGERRRVREGAAAPGDNPRPNNW